MCTTSATKTTTISCHAAKEAKGNLVPYDYTPETIRPGEVEIDISHCGICHSDVHLVDGDWGPISQYPLIPGHEIIGTVTTKGDRVPHLEIGQRVGIGWQRAACLHCKQCLNGDDNLCLQGTLTCAMGNPGGFAERIRVSGHYAFPVPESLDSENAAPLLCAGITTYAPLRHYGITPNMKVGVIGIGGLGHLGLQFARAYGCEVTAFSHSPNKASEAGQFGAHHFISSTDPDALEKAANSLDFIMCTASKNIAWEAYMNILKPDGKFCILGAAEEPINLGAFPLILGRKTIGGSPVGSRHLIHEMLEFAARHNITAVTETMPFDKANEALDKVRQSKAHYRMVLVR